MSEEYLALRSSRTIPNFSSLVIEGCEFVLAKQVPTNGKVFVSVFPQVAQYVAGVRGRNVYARLSDNSVVTLGDKLTINPKVSGAMKKVEDPSEQVIGFAVGLVTECLPPIAGERYCFVEMV